MNIKQKINQLPWRLIIALGVIALVRPIVKIFGEVFDYTVSPGVTLLLTAAIALVWVSIAVKLKVKRPIVVLAMSGATYAVLSIVMAVIIQFSMPSLADEEAKIPILLTAGLVAATIFNFIYGAVLGFIASIIQKHFNK